MAKINESVMVIKVSELVADSAEPQPLLDQETVEQLQAVIAELVGGNALVEIEQA